jgi:hypothetical protein
MSFLINAFQTSLSILILNNPFLKKFHDNESYHEDQYDRKRYHLNNSPRNLSDFTAILNFYKQTLKYLYEESYEKIKFNQIHHKQIEELQNMKDEYDENQKLNLLRSIFENCII